MLFLVDFNACTMNTALDPVDYWLFEFIPLSTTPFLANMNRGVVVMPGALSWAYAFRSEYELVGEALLVVTNGGAARCVFGAMH